MAPTALSDLSDRAVDIIDMADMEDRPQIQASVQESSTLGSYTENTLILLREMGQASY